MQKNHARAYSGDGWWCIYSGDGWWCTVNTGWWCTVDTRGWCTYSGDGWWSTANTYRPKNVISGEIRARVRTDGDGVLQQAGDQLLVASGIRAASALGLGLGSRLVLWCIMAHKPDNIVTC